MDVEVEVQQSIRTAGFVLIRWSSRVTLLSQKGGSNMYRSQSNKNKLIVAICKECKCLLGLLAGYLATLSAP